MTNLVHADNITPPGSILKDICVSLSFSCAFFLSEWLNLLGDASPFSEYEMPYRYPSVFPALLTCVIGLSLLFFALLWIARKSPRGRIAGFVYILLFAVLIFPLNAIRVATGFSIRFPFFSYTFFARIFPNWVLAFLLPLLGVMAAFLIWKYCRGLLARLVHGLGLMLIPAIVILFGNFAVLWSQTRVIPFLEKGLNLEKVQTKPPIHVVWIIFDELDQRLAFEKRPAGLRLPEFDRLQSESISFSQAFPPAGNTIESIPGLLTGKALRITRFEANDMLLRAASTGAELRLSTAATVFGEVQKLGFKTGLVGWFHPYCAIFNGQLDACYRHSRARLDYSRQWLKNIALILVRSCRIANTAAYVHADDVKRLSAGAKRIAANADFGLSFIHLPIPHGPWIYHAQPGEISINRSQEPTGYFDNLAFADSVLGEIRAAMEIAGVWDTSVFIVSSDHNWRESNRYDGIKDLRVPLFIHMPKGDSARVTGMTPTYLTASFVTQLLQNKINNTDEATAWFRKQSAGYQPDFTQYDPHPEENW